MTQGTVSAPLHGVRVLDMTHIWAGPLAVRFLADLGADVVKIEAPLGRGTRNVPSAPIGGWLGGDPGDEPWNNNALFVKLNRNRRSVCLDLKKQQGRDLFLRLVAHADVVVENFSARAMDNLDLGYSVLKQANPRIIYVCMPGFGKRGALSDRVAFGPTVEAMSGLQDLFGYSDSEPRNTAMALMDPIAATHAFAAVMTALEQRAHSGKGCEVELSLHEGGVAYHGPWLLDKQLGHDVTCLGNRHPQMCPHGIFRCRGADEWVAIACETDEDWQRLAPLLGGECDSSWRLDARRRREDAIEAEIARFTRRFSKADVTERLQRAGIPAGPVNGAPEFIEDSQSRARAYFGWHERGDTPMPGNPIRMAGIDAADWRSCPALGEHNAEVLSEWLEVDPQTVQTLEAGGVLATAPPY